MNVVFSIRVQVRGLSESSPREEAEFSCELPEILIYKRNIKDVTQELFNIAVSRFEQAVCAARQEKRGDDEKSV